MNIRGYADGDEAKIPKAPGLYAFYLDVLSPSRIGLYAKRAYSEEQLEAARERAVSRVAKAIKFIRSIEAEGTIKATGKSGQAASEFSVSLRELYPAEFINELRTISTEALIPFLNIAKHTTLFCQPIYVGITKEQTLYDRYKQHRNDYESYELRRDKNAFGCRLKESGFDWDDVIFACVKVMQDEKHYSAILTAIEKHMHALSKPVLSLR